jgi:3-phosphoglycerate kinase
MKKVPIEDSTTQNIIEIGESSESDDEVQARIQYVVDRLRNKRSQKVEIPQSYQKEKSLKRKRKPESSSDYEPNDEENVIDIVTSTIRKSGSKKALTMVPLVPMDNASFHCV